MALARLNTLESLRHCAPGEWGKLPGLDRAPEVRTLRQKIHQLAHDGQPAQWCADLCGQWMAAAPEQAGVLYVDGHVRVCHGGQTQLPRHPVARQNLCLRATVDYWVNAMDGQPFFAVNQAADPGLIQVLEQDILPRLLRDVPGQPDAEALEGDLTSIGFSHPPPPTVQIAKVGPLISGKLGHPSGRPGLTGRS